jgi:serine/threonine protein kinase
MEASSDASGSRVIGRYALYGEIASGGMATVHFGRLLGAVGFSRTVAIKRLHPHLAKDPEFVSMFLDEARLAARIRHPNVVQTLDVVALEGELFLVLDYVQGESLAQLVRPSEIEQSPIPLDIVSGIICGALLGLHAAHEATNEQGEPLHIVHRDVSPQNILVGADGVPRVLDFGVAKAKGRVQTTREGQLKGKLAYMAPEQLSARPVDRRTDVYAMGVVFWEALTLQRLFGGESEADTFRRVLLGDVAPPSSLVPTVPKDFDEIVGRALAQGPPERFDTARDMALAIEKIVPMASATRVGEWLEGLAGHRLALRAKVIAQIESESSGSGYTNPTHTEDVPTKTATSLDSERSKQRRLPARLAMALGGLGAAAAILYLIVAAPASPTNARPTPRGVVFDGAPVGITRSPEPVASTLTAPPSSVPQAPPPSVSTAAGASAPPPLSGSAPPVDSTRVTGSGERRKGPSTVHPPGASLPSKGSANGPEARDPLDTSH